MTKYKRRFDYWHLVTKINKSYAKEHPELEVGFYISHPYKNNGSVCMINRTTGKTYKNAYTMEYLGRVLIGSTNKDTLAFLKICMDKLKKIKETSK